MDKKLAWGLISGQMSLGMLLALVVPKNSFMFVPANIAAIALLSSASVEIRRLEKNFEDLERKEDMLFALKEAQGEEQVQYLESAAETKRANENADALVERDLARLQAIAPILSEVIKITGANGAIERMALGMLQNGASLGDTLLAVADTEVKIKQAEMSVNLQQEQMRMQSAIAQQQLQPQHQPYLPPVSPTEAIVNTKTHDIKKAAVVVGIKTECVRQDKAPSYQRLIFKLRTEDFKLLPNWKQAACLALGVDSKKEALPSYIFDSEQIAFEIPLKPEERTYYDFPIKNWKLGDRLITLGQSLDGEINIDLGNEDTPQVLVVGTTGSGKSNFLRAAAYCLLMQGARVEVCGGKISDYEDFPDRFPTVNINDMGETFKYVEEYYQECDRRNKLTKQELSQQPAWVLLIDEYKGTVPLDNDAKKAYDDQLCEIVRRGRGLKIHVIVGLQQGSLRKKEDPQGLPSDLRSNMPCRIAFRCVDAKDGRMVLHRNGEIVTALQGRGDGVVQAGALNQRFQSYRFEKIPG